MQNNLKNLIILSLLYKYYNANLLAIAAPGSPQMAHSRYPSGVNEITVKKGKAISLSSADEKASSPKSNVCSTCSVPIRYCNFLPSLQVQYKNQLKDQSLVNQWLIRFYI